MACFANAVQIATTLQASCVGSEARHLIDGGGAASNVARPHSGELAQCGFGGSMLDGSGVAPPLALCLDPRLVADLTDTRVA